MGLDTNRVLRVGVVFKGQILAERVLSRRSDVSVGVRPGSTVEINAKDHPDFPASLQLATLHKDAYHLVVPSDPNASVNLRGGVAGSQGISAKDVVEVKGQRLVSIEAYTGGSLAFGDVILMFQFVRSDSVPTVTHEETVLRIGLVHESRLLTDKLFKVGTVVRVGSGLDDTLVLPDVDYKGGSAVFTVEKTGKVQVKLPPGANLRLATDGTPMDEAEALRKGVARKVGDGVELSIGLKSRGRATLGPYTVLFQVVRQTVTVPVMPRKSLFGQIVQPLVSDPIWSISFFVSLLLIGSVVGQAVIFYRTTGQYIKQQQLEDMHMATTYEVLVEDKEEPEPEKEEVDIKSDEAKKAEVEEVKKEKEPEKRKADPVEKPQSTGETKDPTDKKQVVAAVTEKSVLKAFGSQGAATRLFGDAEEGAEGAVVAQTFGGDGSDAAGPAGGGLDLAGNGGGGGGATVEIQTGNGKVGFGKRDPGVVKVAADNRAEKKVTISLSGSMSGSGEAKADIGKVISRKNSAVQRCYENALRGNPNLSGKVTVRFTVGTAGTVTEASVLGAEGDFAECIKDKFLRIRGLPILTSPQSFSQSYVFTKN